MNDYRTIRPHFGLGDLRFGANYEEVRAYLGEPDTVTELVSRHRWITWEYSALGIDASFDPEYDERLLALTTERQDALLNGHRLIGLTGETILNRLQDYGLGKYRTDNVLVVGGWEAESDLEDLEMRFDHYGEETVDRLQFISWSVHITENDVVMWPQ